MVQSSIKKLWGTVIGGTFGAVFGMIYATYVSTEGSGLPHYVGHYGNWQPYPVMEVSIVIFAALGYFMIHTITVYKTCDNCSGENPRNAKMCQFCGKAFDKANVESMVCLSCNGQYSSHARFCPMCAVELKSAQEIQQKARAKNPPVTKECSACCATNMPQRTVCHKCGNPV